MGTLDEAIREHLELKRRSGAADDEVSRLENEAFGAARREPPAPAADTPEEPAAPASEVPPPPPAPAAAPEPAAPAPAPESAAAVPVTPPAPAPPPVVPDDSWLDDDDVAEPELPSVPSEPAAREPRAPEPPPSQDFVAPDEEGDDLLEETPDFLQETPEHDRLWFEQKPPRDFEV